jgi:hypothetical protein
MPKLELLKPGKRLFFVRRSFLLDAGAKSL